MKPEIIILGVQLPTLVPLFVFTGVVMFFLDRQFAASSLYNRIWHPALFRTAVFVLIFTSLALLIY
ncbi:MAG: DUF1656 domain-containing protein [Betaproteobacteria bacterium]|nr:DUF1656 domain-containing protein [Betaproteobacteria bacterium]MDE2422746.1 DUF1656 domain-containing protein [Betaproteobacteria bacterium]